MISCSLFRNILTLVPMLVFAVAAMEKACFEATLAKEIDPAEKTAGASGWDTGEDGGAVETFLPGGT